MATDESFLGPARMPFFDGAESVYINGQEVQSIVITETGAILFEKGGEVVEDSLKLFTEYNVVHDNPTLLFNIVNSNSIYDTDTGELNIVDIDLSLNAQTINAFYGDPTNSTIPIVSGVGFMQISDTSNPIHYIFQNEENNIYQEVFFDPWVSEENKVTDILKTFEIVYTGSNFSSSGTPYEGEKIYAEFDGRYANFYPTDSNVSFGYTSAQGEHRVTMYNVTGLNKNSYYNTYSSMKFYLYEGIQTLYEECFASSDITEIDIPTSVSTMGNKIFANCTQLTSITLNWTKAEDIITYNSTWTQGILIPPMFTVPTGTTQLYIDKGYSSAQVYEEPLKFTFEGTKLTQNSNGDFDGTNMIIDYGDGTVKSTTGTFGHTYSENGTYQVKIYGVSSLGDNCFFGCTGLTSITIPNSVTSIGANCFTGCTGLISIEISSSITSFGDFCFSNCTDLTSITIPDGITSLGDNCFFGCTDLTSITIPNSVTTIEVSCFGYCTSLTSIIIPNSVTNLGANCFKGCSGLNDYYLNWTSASTIIAYDSNKMPNNTNTIFHIPYGTTQLYIDKGYPSNKLQELTE